MSPAIYNKIKGKNKSSVFDAKKNDYHALGMTLLNMGVQDSVRNYYNEDGSVNTNNLQGHIQNFRNSYPNNPALTENISSMTNPDENLRSINFA